MISHGGADCSMANEDMVESQYDNKAGHQHRGRKSRAATGQSESANVVRARTGPLRREFRLEVAPTTPQRRNLGFLAYIMPRVTARRLEGDR